MRPQPASGFYTGCCRMPLYYLVPFPRLSFIIQVYEVYISHIKLHFFRFEKYIVSSHCKFFIMAIPSTSNSVLDPIAAKTIQRAKILDLPSVSNSEQIPSVDIIDIRHDAVELNLKEEILTSLRPQKGPKQLPTLLLYDERGLQLFEQASLRQSFLELCKCS